MKTQIVPVISSSCINIKYRCGAAGAQQGAAVALHAL